MNNNNRANGFTVRCLKDNRRSQLKERKKCFLVCIIKSPLEKTVKEFVAFGSGDFIPTYNLHKCIFLIEKEA